ncbi:MAG: hypothetical protein V1660_01165 [archaeon]
MNEYFIYSQNGKFSKHDLEEYAKIISLPKEISISTYSNELPDINIWSARLSTGLFGLASCKAGNRGPKGFNEVVLSTGKEGLNKLVKSGFIPCPLCRPEKIDGFWDSIKEIVKREYSIETLEDFIDKKKLPFDARRVRWEELLPIIGDTPDRLYLPKGLVTDELIGLKKRFENIGFKLPHTGYYNPDVPERFSEYLLA